MAEAAHAHDHPPAGGPSRAKVLTREPLVLNHRNYSWITSKIAGVVENPQPKVWWLIFIPCFLLTLVMASLSGSIIGVALIASKRGNMKYALPFGTFLAIGAVVSAAWGTPIVDWYFGFYQ